MSARLVDPQRQLDLLRAVMAWDPPVRIFGGFAEDALLHGRVSRPHEDIDVVVPRDELELRIEQARALGFRSWHLRMECAPGTPLVVGSIEDGLNLEFVLFDRHADGSLSFDVPTRVGRKRVFLPPDATTGAPARIHDVEVRTVSPLALYQIRLGAAETFGGMRAKDKVSQAALRARFFADAPEDTLAPKTRLVERWPAA